MEEEKMHPCPGCGVFLPKWDPICDSCFERGNEEESEDWLLELQIEQEEADRLLRDHPGRPDFGAKALRERLGGGDREKA